MQRCRTLFAVVAVSAAAVSCPAAVHISHAATTGLVAAYSFDEGGGTTASDASGNGNTATFAAETWTAGGKFAGAARFDGTSARVNVPDASSLDMTAGVTLEAWVRPTVLAPSQTVIAKERAGGGFPYGLELDNGVPSAYIVASSNAVARATSALPLSTWSFLAATYDGSTLRVYVNGAQVASTSVSGAIATSTGPLSIGADTAWGEYLSGDVDNVRVYNRALSVSELQGDQSAAIAAPPGTAPSPAAAYAFDEAGGSDTTPPSTPANLSASAVSSSQIHLSWTASTDNVGVTGYRVFRGGTQVGTSTTTTYSDTGLAASTTYSYTVAAYDAAGNLSAQSQPASATTSAGGGSDTTPPSTPANLS